MVCISCVLHEPITVNCTGQAVHRRRGNFLGKDDSCYIIWAIYNELFIYECRVGIFQRKGNQLAPVSVSCMSHCSATSFP